MYAQISDTVSIPDKDDNIMTGGASSYLHFNDLDEIRKKHPDAEAFRVVNGYVQGRGECTFVILVKELKEGGALKFLDQAGDWVALSCPRVLDTKGNGTEFKG
ncbi:MAG: hypothetical protein AAF849_12005 [Bacteroidota bacterium]